MLLYADDAQRHCGHPRCTGMLGGSEWRNARRPKESSSLPGATSDTSDAPAPANLRRVTTSARLSPKIGDAGRKRRREGVRGIGATETDARTLTRRPWPPRDPHIRQVPKRGGQDVGASGTSARAIPTTHLRNIARIRRSGHPAGAKMKGQDDFGHRSMTNPESARDSRPKLWPPADPMLSHF